MKFKFYAFPIKQTVVFRKPIKTKKGEMVDYFTLAGDFQRYSAYVFIKAKNKKNAISNFRKKYKKELKRDPHKNNAIWVDKKRKILVSTSISQLGQIINFIRRCKENRTWQYRRMIGGPIIFNF